MGNVRWPACYYTDSNSEGQLSMCSMCWPDEGNLSIDQKEMNQEIPRGNPHVWYRPRWLSHTCRLFCASGIRRTQPRVKNQPQTFPINVYLSYPLFLLTCMPLSFCSLSSSSTLPTMLNGYIRNLLLSLWWTDLDDRAFCVSDPFFLSLIGLFIMPYWVSSRSHTSVAIPFSYL